MWERKLKRFEGSQDCTTSIMLSFTCPFKRENFMQGIHSKQDCPRFGVLGRLSEVWVAYLKGRMNN